jgi:hypothetical protein
MTRSFHVFNVTIWTFSNSHFLLARTFRLFDECVKGAECRVVSVVCIVVSVGKLIPMNDNDDCLAPLSRRATLLDGLQSRVPTATLGTILEARRRLVDGLEEPSANEEMTLTNAASGGEEKTSLRLPFGHVATETSGDSEKPVALFVNIIEESEPMPCETSAEVSLCDEVPSQSSNVARLECSFDDTIDQFFGTTPNCDETPLCDEVSDQSEEGSETVHSLGDEDDCPSDFVQTDGSASFDTTGKNWSLVKWQTDTLKSDRLGPPSPVRLRRRSTVPIDEQELTAEMSMSIEQNDLDVTRSSLDSMEPAAGLSTTTEDGDAEEPLRSIGAREPRNKSPALPIDNELLDSERVRELAEDSPSMLAIPVRTLHSDEGEQKSSRGGRERSTHPMQRDSSLRGSSHSTDSGKPSKARSSHSRLSRREDQGQASVQHGSRSGSPNIASKSSSRRSSDAQRSSRSSSSKDSGSSMSRNRTSPQEKSTRRKAHTDGRDDPQKPGNALSSQRNQGQQLEMESSHSASSSRSGQQEDSRMRGRGKNGRAPQNASAPECSGRRASSTTDAMDSKSDGTPLGHEDAARCDPGSNSAESVKYNASFCVPDSHCPIGLQKSRSRSSLSHDDSGKEDRWMLISQELQSRSFIDILLERSKELQTVVVEFDGHSSLDQLALHSYHAGTSKKRNSKGDRVLDGLQRTRTTVPLDSVLTKQRSGPPPKRRGSTGTIE